MRGTLWRGIRRWPGPQCERECDATPDGSPAHSSHFLRRVGGQGLANYPRGPSRTSDCGQAQGQWPIGIGPWGGAVRLGLQEGAGAGRRIWLWDAQQQAVESCHGGVVSAGVHAPDWLEAKATKSLSDGSAARGAAEALHCPASTEPRGRREKRTREWREIPEQRNCGCWLPCASTAPPH